MKNNGKAMSIQTTANKIVKTTPTETHTQQHTCITETRTEMAAINNSKDTEKLKQNNNNNNNDNSS
jgi:hypothetical protein